jgi:four helix bundle protein
MSDSIMLDKAKDFAVDIVNLCRQISFEKKEYVLTKQLMRSGTSIGANIHESKYAQSKPDFVSKMQIALKECYESEYWLEIMNRTALLSTEQYRIYLSKCGALRRMLISSIKTTKSNIE